MSPLILLLTAVQAGFLFWAAQQAGGAFFQTAKAGAWLRVLATLAVPLAIAWFGYDADPYRIVCGPFDCFVLTLSVGFVKFWAETREAEQFALEREIASRLAAEKMEQARKAAEAERLKVAAATLAARAALPVTAAPAPAVPAPARHLTPSLLPGGARPRFPAPRNLNSPRK